MKQLFQRLFKRKPWWVRDANEIPAPDSRRVTHESASPLNKVLARPAVSAQAKPTSPVDRVLGNADLNVADEEFNPYNTSAFDRASSWDKISRKRKS